MNINHIKSIYDEGDKHINTPISGRVKQIRSFGKIHFLKIEDVDDIIQVVLQGKMDLPDYWDIIQIENFECKKTQKGEQSLWSNDYEIIVKCQSDVSNKHKGMQDEQKIALNPIMSHIDNPSHMRNLKKRHGILKEIRSVMDENGFIEIETPVLSNGKTGASAETFKTYHNAEGQEKHLRIATEVPLKKALISGLESVYEIGKIFRNEGVDKTHNPEFTSMEMYSVNFDLNRMKNFLIDLIIKLQSPYDSSVAKVPRIKIFEYEEIVSEYGEDFDEKLNEENTLYFVSGQPLEQTPLCAAREDGKADRFEAFMNGFEIANAFNELTDPEEQRRRIPEGDDGLVHAMKYGMPKCAGMGIGIDRLTMIMCNTDNIHDVIFSV